jgi:HPt (histidine-containing phosphotransfer) domain-containing protein
MKTNLKLQIAAIEQQPRIDRGYISEMTDFDDGDLLDGLISVFAEQSEKQLAMIHLLFACNDVKTISQIAHRMRSTCFNVGARRLAKIFEFIELESIQRSQNDLTLRDFIVLAEEELGSTTRELTRTRRARAA